MGGVLQNARYKQEKSIGKMKNKESIRIKTDVVERKYPDGKMWYRFSVTDGVLNGQYDEWYSNGKIRFQGMYQNGMRNGPYKKWRANGELYIDQEYVNDKLVADRINPKNPKIGKIVR